MLSGQEDKYLFIHEVIELTAWIDSCFFLACCAKPDWDDKKIELS